MSFIKLLKPAHQVNKGSPDKETKHVHLAGIHFKIYLSEVNTVNIMEESKELSRWLDRIITQVFFISESLEVVISFYVLEVIIK